MSTGVAAAIVIIIGLGPVVYLFQLVWRVFMKKEKPPEESEEA